MALSREMGAEKKTALKDESRYDIFVKAQSVKLQESEPHLAQTQRMARIGQLWKSMTKEERLQVILDHKALMAANGIKDKATVNYGPMLKVGGLKRRQHERRISAFNFFVKDTVAKLRAGNPDLEHEACMKRVGEMWRALSQEERAKWCLDPPMRGERGAKCGEPKDIRGSRSSGSVGLESPLEQSMSPIAPTAWQGTGVPARRESAPVVGVATTATFYRGGRRAHGEGGASSKSDPVESELVKVSKLFLPCKLSKLARKPFKARGGGDGTASNNGAAAAADAGFAGRSRLSVILRNGWRRGACRGIGSW